MWTPKAAEASRLPGPFPQARFAIERALVRAETGAVLLWAVSLVVSPATAAGQTTRLMGAVVDSVTGRPLAGVELYAPDGRSAFSGGDGHFRMEVPTGRSLLLLRRIGYVPRALTVEVSDGAAPQVNLGTLWLKPLPVELTSIVVESTLVAVNPRLADFYRRRKRRAGGGYYITQDEIWQKTPLSTSDLLREIPNIHLDCTDPEVYGCVPINLRRVTLYRIGCPMQVILDGMPTSLSLDEIHPASIAGIEVYKGVFAPLLHGASPCGTVVVWTGPDLPAQLRDAR